MSLNAHTKRFESARERRRAASIPDETRAARGYIPGFMVILALLVAACSEEAAPPSLDDVRSEIEPTQESWDVHYVVSEAERRAEESRPRMEIRADYMATYETSDSTYTVMRADTLRTDMTRTDTTRTDTSRTSDTGTREPLNPQSETRNSATRNAQDATARRVIAYLYDEEGDRSATVRANRLILHEADRRFEAKGNVTVETPEGKTLDSEHLVWLEDDRKVRTPGFVRIRTPKENVQGYNLVADEDLETYTLARVTGQVTYEEEEDDEVVSDTASADGGVE